MKRIRIYMVLLIILMISATSCKKDFNQIGEDLNRPINVPPSLLLNGALNKLYNEPFGDNLKWNQYFLQNYDYYGNNRYDFGSGEDYYTTLKNVVKMEEEAANSGLPTVNVYAAMAKFLKAYFFTQMSLEMGDIPMNEALMGLKNLTPAYDTQKQVFKQSLDSLESANSDFAELLKTTATLSGDIYLNNDLSKWQKVVNAYRLRLLIHLSNKADDTDLKVKEQFSNIINNPDKYPLMEGLSDNLQYNYVYPTNKYPKNPASFGYDALRENCSDTYVSILTSIKDPRVFVTCEPAAVLFKAADPTNFSAFVGANAGEDLGVMYVKANSGQYSLLNRYHFYRTYNAESTIQIGYPEMCFDIAEAINRGWVPSKSVADAEAYYKKGIQASMSFYGIPSSGAMDVHFFKTGSSIDGADAFNTYSYNFDFDTYYAQSDVKYAGNNATGINQILKQRYLALFAQSGLESYYTYRRTGVPTFGIGPGTGNSGRIALRFQYPEGERTTNTENYNAALSSQFGGNDDINGKMWILN